MIKGIILDNVKLIKGYGDFKKQGVYCIYNLYNSKFYIGSSNYISKRVWEHFYALDKNQHYNQYLQRSYNKYKDYFIAFPIEVTQKEEEILISEQYWIDRLNAVNPAIGYNLSPSVNGTRGYRHTEEALLKMSLAKQGKNHHNYGKPLPKITKRRISEANRGKVRTEETKQLLRELNLGKTHSEETKRKISDSLKKKSVSDEQLEFVTNLNAKATYQYDKDFNLIATWESSAEAARQLGFKRAQINRVCRGERNTYRGFRWSYIPLDK